MKRLNFFFGVIGLALSAACSENLSSAIDGTFAKVNAHGQLLFWQKQQTDGRYELIKLGAGGHRLKLDSGTDYCILNSRKEIPADLGDSFTVRLRASGHGQVLLGPIWYNARHRWLANGFVEQAVTGQLREYSHTFKVSTIYLKGAKSFVVIVGVPCGSQAEIENVELFLTPNPYGEDDE